MTSSLTPPPDFTPEPLELAPAGTPLVDLAETVPDDAPAASSRRKLPGHRSRILLDDPTAEDGVLELVVRVDNRDYLRWDKTAPRQKWGPARDVPFLVASFTSWSAAKRAGLFLEEFPAFEARCLEIAQVEEDDEDDAARPTR